MAVNYILIPCEVSPGQFASEQAVTIKLSNGQSLTLFADKNLIASKDSKKFLKVTKIESGRGRANNEEIVLLPTEAFESGSRWLRLSHSQLAMP